MRIHSRLMSGIILGWFGNEVPDMLANGLVFIIVLKTKAQRANSVNEALAKQYSMSQFLGFDQAGETLVQ